MDPVVRQAIFDAVDREPFVQTMNMRLVHLEAGHSIVEMPYVSDTMDNMYQRAHGGAIFALIDEAFETAGQSDGTIAVALNVNITYVTSPEHDTLLRAEAKKISQTKKTAAYDIKVHDAEDRLIATCHALAYCTGKPIPFLP